MHFDKPMKWLIIPLAAFLVSACIRDMAKERIESDKYGRFDPTPYDLQLPPFAPHPFLNPDNPLTEEGVTLGHHLFFDPILSSDNTISCATCHQVEFGMTDGLQFSEGIRGQIGRRNSMPLFNLVFQKEFFWDGRAVGLEEQALLPIQDHTEMDLTLEEMSIKLKGDTEYPAMFYHAFGTDEPTPDLVARALAQYLRTLISLTSKFDSAKYLNKGFLSESELRGFNLSQSLIGGDCVHCHNEGNKLFSDFKFRNNGHTEAATIHEFPDAGRGEVTGKPEDYGTFKTASFRNLVFTAPYMHDGRFWTLEEVIDHYSEGLKVSPTVNRAELEHVDSGGVHLTPQEQADIVAFLKSLTDYTMKENPLFNKPAD